MGNFIINLTLISMLAMFAALILRAHNLRAVVVLASAFSLTATGLFVVLDAVDVAFTEAAVGAGLTTVLAFTTLALVPQTEKPHGISWTATLLALATGALLMFAVSDLPSFGSADAPIHHHVAPHYITQSGTEIGVPNIVTAVLASYRGFDTFGEVVVVFTAAIAVLAILGGRTHAITRTIRRKKSKEKATRKKRSDKNAR